MGLGYSKHISRDGKGPEGFEALGEARLDSSL